MITDRGGAVVVVAIVRMDGLSARVAVLVKMRVGRRRASATMTATAIGRR